MALGRIEAAEVLLDVAEESPRVRHHPLFNGACRVFHVLSLESKITQASGPAWNEVRNQLEALRLRLESHLPRQKM